MQSENKTCQNCKQEFIIESEDFDFYQKIDVPPPTWCPDCRLQRRLAFFNERTLYRRSCDLCKKNFVSIFPQDASYTVYCPECWHSGKWDPLSYGRNYDFSKPFFLQLKKLFEDVPQIGRNVTSSTLINSDYCSSGTYLKNCYLVFNSDNNEDCMYSTYLERSKNSLDLYMADMCERCYDSSNLFKDFNVRFSSNCNECIDVSFSKNCIGCSNCFGCVNLRNKSYCIFNEQYSKEEYTKKIKEFDMGSFRFVQEMKGKLDEFSFGYPHKYAEGLNNSNVSGDYIFHSKNTFYSYEVGDCEDCKFCHFLFVFPTKDSYDYTMWGGNAERMYECMGTGGGAKDVRFCFNTWLEQANMEFSKDIILGSRDIFGCAALTKKRFCILNKQYSEKEYRDLREKIIKHIDEMPYTDSKDRAYRYGEFLPPEISPFGYNETLAQVHFPLMKEQAEQQGFRWREEKENSYSLTIDAKNMPDNIRNAEDSILREVIECEHRGKCNHQCPGAFKITPQELEFYRHFVIPLPRLCSNCRHYNRFFGRNSISKFWKRECQCAGLKSGNGVYGNQTNHRHGDEHCPNEFETSYSPERPEIVYCEQCYNSEVA